VHKLFDAAVPDQTTVEAKRLSQALHSFQVKNEVVREENENLRTSLNTKKKRAKKSKHLRLSQQKESHSNAVFYSPSTIEGFELEDQKERKKEAEQLQKKHQKELQKVHNIYQKQIAAEKREQRKRDSEAKKKEKAARVVERLAAKERKE
jgi:hypothetical protein